MDSLRSILVDDELSSLQNLQHKLEEFCPDVKVVATALQPEEALLLIKEHKPDLIFLDIEMPRMNGFRMLDELDEYDFDIIFTTAYDHYAVDAIRISAFDYLTKPIAINELQNAVNRLLKNRQATTGERLNVLRQTLSENKNQEASIAIPTSDGLEFLVIKNIVHIESSANYSKIYLSNGKTILVTRLLKDFEEMLVPYRFFRVHHSHLINLNYIQKYIRGDGGQVVMQTGETIDVARRKKDDFLALIS